MPLKMVATLDNLISIETKQFVTDVFGATYFEMLQTVYRNSISAVQPTLS